MSSPQTPRHSRHSSTVDAYPESPQARRISHDPALTHRNSFTQQDTFDLNDIGRGDSNTGNGMGNLADELADAFSDSGDEEAEDELADRSGPQEAKQAGQVKDRADEGESMAKGSTRLQDGNLSPPSPRRKGHRKNGSAYDGSDYGSESDLDPAGLPPSLIAKIDAVESLARRGTEANGGPGDDVVKRVTDALRDLGSQSSVEGSASR